MCFIIPKKIISKSGSTAIIEGGMKVDIEGLPDATVGDYIYVTAGIAVAKVDRNEAESMRSLMKQTYDELR